MPYGLKSQDEWGDGLAKKPTNFMTNSPEIAKELSLRCTNQNQAMGVWKEFKFNLRWQRATYSRATSSSSCSACDFGCGKYGGSSRFEGSPGGHQRAVGVSNPEAFPRSTNHQLLCEEGLHSSSPHSTYRRESKVCTGVSRRFGTCNRARAVETIEETNSLCLWRYNGPHQPGERH